MTDPKHPDPEESSPTSPEPGAESPSVSQDDWADALAEQTAHDQPTQAAGLSQDDDWADALAEQTAAQGTGTQAGSAATPAAAQVFQPLTGQSGTDEAEIDMIMDIPVQLSVELGRTRLTIKNILQLGQGSVVELDGLAGEPMDIYVNG
ncbi:MAG: FliM/FliN family flagellar motor switch protein, partial [Alcaligenaceae bacterium]|nr:FliM/FliN family flagellar motor switch protein [Alcaligenaceae bacterium]